MGFVSYIFGVWFAVIAATSGLSTSGLALDGLHNTQPDHEYYFSNSDIVFNEKEKSFEITISVFTDDLETVISGDGAHVDLVSKSEDPVISQKLASYLQHNLSLEINGKVADSQYIGVEPDNEITRCYLEVTNVSPIETMRISNKILTDLHESQQNIVYVKIGSKKHCLRYEKDSHTQDLSL